ncbi:MAG: putative lipid II flippase FtsW [Clostridia bacterium]|nr:putative lipid II flippase FtsW [Clostridia bacterium]
MRNLSTLKGNPNNYAAIRLIVCTLSLSLLGLLMLYSASSYSAHLTYGDAFYFVKKQAIALFIGVVCMFALANFKIEKLIKLRYPILIVSFVLLIIIFIPAVGVENYGAKRWINLGFMTMQPSEVAKFGYVIFCAAYISKKGTHTFKNMLPVLLIGAAICVLLMLEPNMSITICVGAVMLMLLFAGGAKAKHFATLFVPTAALIPVMIIMEPYRLQRIMAFIDPWAAPKAEGYQLIQSYYALGSGGFFGVGLFNSRQKYLFLPFAESDFIFSIIGEELGFIGCVAVILVFLYMIYLGYSIASKANSRYAAILAFGITSIIAVQSVLNIAVVSGAVPPTGLPLPFLSYGGSSLVCFTSAIGILLSICRHNCDTLVIKNHSM